MSDRNSGTDFVAPHDEESTSFPGQVTGEEMDTESVVKGRNARKFDDTLLRGIASFDDAVALAETVLGEPVVDAAEEIGNGFTVLPTDAKDRLIGVRFVVLAVDFNEGDNGNYCTALVVTESGERFVLNDGSTGVYSQLEDWTVKSGKSGGLLVNGLRRSEYDRQDDEALRVKDETGRVLRATTYYLNV